MDSIGNVAAGPLVVLTRVDDNHGFARVEFLLDVAEILFLDAGFCFFYKLEKSLGMIRHDLPRSCFAVQPIKFSTLPPATLGAITSYHANWDRPLFPRQSARRACRPLPSPLLPVFGGSEFPLRDLRTKAHRAPAESSVT